MSTPITDAVTSADHLIDTARRLELDRAALMEALECALEWVPETATIMHEKAESALAAARANFPTP